MAVTGIHTCNFVVWTPFDFVVITVLFDKLMEQSLLPNSQTFFTPHAIAEIVYPKHPIELPDMLLGILLRLRDSVPPMYGLSSHE